MTRKYLNLTEQHKEISFLEKNPIIKEIISKITPLINGIGIIFGSYAKGTQKKDSDLDVFVIGEYKRDKIKQIEEAKRWRFSF